MAEKPRKEAFMRNVTKVVLGLLICSFVSCGSSGTSYGRLTDSMNLTAGPDESEVIIKRTKAFIGSAVDMIIFIDGQPQLTLGNSSSGKIIVKNGTYTIHAEIGVGKSSKVEFTAQSNRITFSIYPYQHNESAFSASLVVAINKESEFALTPTSK
jgi:hypothetical protein